MDPGEKLRRTLDALYGPGASRALPRGLEFELSRRTGRPRAARAGGELLCTMRTDGGLALTVRLAEALLSRPRFARDACVEVGDDAAPFVREGRSVFCGHVARCGRGVRPGSDVAVLHRGRVIAVGRAALGAEAVASLRRGVAVRVRDSLKGRPGGAGAA